MTVYRYVSLLMTAERVSNSLCRLELPAWYSQSPSRSASRSASTPVSPRWRRDRSSSSWRRGQSERSDTPDSGRQTSASVRWSIHRESSATSSSNKTQSCDNCSVPVSTVKSSNSYLSYRQPYFGWRSLERLKLSGSSLLSPDQRLAASLLNQVRTEVAISPYNILPCYTVLLSGSANYEDGQNQENVQLSHFPTTG